jgi:parallel beta-helix repeat protein
MSNNWTIEYNEIGGNKGTGIVFGVSFLIRNNYIHHNTYSGYLASHADNTTFDSNEIAYNGAEQKVTVSANVTFRNNFVHHNAGAGIWYDTSNTGALIEGNRVEDNGWIGIDYGSAAMPSSVTTPSAQPAGRLFRRCPRIADLRNTLNQFPGHRLPPL